MSFSDSVGDLLTRIRNGQSAMMRFVLVLKSNLNSSILYTLQDEGYISKYEDVPVDGHDQTKVWLKYNEGKAVISAIKRISKPGRRVYMSYQDLPKFYNGLGILVLSTPQGVISSIKAKQLKAGGEVLCGIF